MGVNGMERRWIKGAHAMLAAAFALVAALGMVLVPAKALAAEGDAGAPMEGVVAQDQATSQDEVIPDAMLDDFADDGFIFDEGALFTADQEAQLEEQAQMLADRHGLGVYLLTCDTMNGLMNPTSNQRTSFAANFYRDHDLGLGGGKDGILLVVAAKSRDYVTVAYGEGSYRFNDSGIEAMEDAVTGQLRGNHWFAAAEAYYDQIGRQLAFYQSTGRTAQPAGLLGWAMRLLLILGVPAAIAGGVVLNRRRAMKTAVMRNEARDYLDPQSLALSLSSDQFVRTGMAVTPRVQVSHGSGGGGGWGGGGGGGFSSSGGGKF